MNIRNHWKLACVFSAVCAAAAVPLSAQTFSVITDFNGADGSDPSYANLLQGLDGDLYGTTFTGGAHLYGTVFKVTPTGTLTTIYSFCSQGGGMCTDGSGPLAGLILGTDGNFYGITTWGGTQGQGTVFKITPAGKLTTLASLGGAQGIYPYGPVVQASDGNLYGTTYTGGANGYGVVFRVTLQGAFTDLHDFNMTAGAGPSAGLIQGADGGLYGTTFSGGTGTACEDGCGTVFRITLSGKLTTLYNFDMTDGACPYARLLQASDGNFYGTTNCGGANGWGTVFKLTPRGVLTTLHSFDSADGGVPYAGLVQTASGDLYGTTRYGGANSDGTAFKIASDGTFTSLFSFDGADGTWPSGGLVEATSGIFYGATQSGGVEGKGTIFSESAGLSPFVLALPSLGKAGAAVRILGTNLGGATSVSFNGTGASFKVVSGSLIEAAVPSGATTGTIQVNTPGGTLSTNLPFRVIQ